MVFSMLHAEKSGRPLGFHHVMDVVYRMTRIGMSNCTLHVFLRATLKSGCGLGTRLAQRPLRHETQPGPAPVYIIVSRGHTLCEGCGHARLYSLPDLSAPEKEANN